MGHYSYALRNWRLGQELIAVAHLYMATEALGNVALRNHKLETGKEDAQLAKDWGIQPVDGAIRKFALLSAARRELIFDGDHSTYSDAHKIRQGFMHAFDDLLKLRQGAASIRDKCAGYVRGAILRYSDVSDTALTTLNDPNHRQPAGMFAVETYMWGSLIGDLDLIGPPQTNHPDVILNRSVDRFHPKDESTAEYDFVITDNFTMSLPEGLGFRASGREIWGPLAPRTAFDDSAERERSE